MQTPGQEWTSEDHLPLFVACLHVLASQVSYIPVLWQACMRQARNAREWSCMQSALQTCPNSRWLLARTVSDNGGWWVLDRALLLDIVGDALWPTYIQDSMYKQKMIKNVKRSSRHPRSQPRSLCRTGRLANYRSCRDVIDTDFNSTAIQPPFDFYSTALRPLTTYVTTVDPRVCWATALRLK